MILTFLYHCLHLHCHDTLKQQNVKLVTVTKGLYYCNNMGEYGRRKMERQGKEVEGGIPIPTNSIMENKNKNGLKKQLVRGHGRFYYITFHSL